MRGWGVFAKSIVIVGVTFMRVTFLVALMGCKPNKDTHIRSLTILAVGISLIRAQYIYHIFNTLLRYTFIPGDLTFRYKPNESTQQ